MSFPDEIITLPNFEIQSKGIISSAFLNKNIRYFNEACKFICDLPYKRNSNKNDLTTLFTDNCGTCSTKHAVLKQLADENAFSELQLMIGLFKMNKKNMPQVSDTLSQYQLEYIPEAHNYLKYKNQIFDFTKPKAFHFALDLIEEIEISSNQITEYKVAYHQNYLQKWLSANSDIPYSLHQIWAIREQCILDLAKD